MNITLTIIVLVSGVLMTLSILLQQRGTGLGAAFGGASNVYRSKQGIEKVLLWFTIVTAFIFTFTSVLTLIFG